MRTVSDLERAVNRTARKTTAKLLAALLGLTGVEREEFPGGSAGSGPGGPGVGYAGGGWSWRGAFDRSAVLAAAGCGDLHWQGVLSW